MACTTILVGKNASYDGSTIVARNEDSPNGQFEPKKMQVVHPEDQPKTYTSVLSHVTFELPDNPMRYSSVPDALSGHGIWAAAGFNTANVGMSATETIDEQRARARCRPACGVRSRQGRRGRGGLRPCHSRRPGRGGLRDGGPAVRAHRARGRAAPLAVLLEQYGTYEMNGIAFSDEDEIWWLEDHRRPPLDRQARARRRLRDHAQPARYRLFRPAGCRGRAGRAHGEPRFAPSGWPRTT